MVDLSGFKDISPYVRMMRLKRAAALTGKWRDIDNVFTYIAAGSGDFVVDGIRYSLHTGNAIIIPPYKTHLIISQGEEPLVQYIMHFDFFESAERVRLVHKDVLDQDDHLSVVSEPEQLLDQKVFIAEIPESERNDMMRRYLCLMREFQEERPGKGMLLKAGCIEILINTLRCSKTIEESKVDKDAKKTKSWLHIENAIAYINGSDLRGELDNDSIANAIKVSPNYLTKVFQEYLGLSLHKYIVNIKIEKAQQLLLSGKINITEAAESAGFSSIHVFSKTFKNTLGISPSEFLDQIVSRENIADNFIMY